MFVYNSLNIDYDHNFMVVMLAGWVKDAADRGYRWGFAS